MKVSALTPEDVRLFVKMEEGEDISPEALLAAALSFVRGQTGLSDGEMDAHEDLAIAVLVLCADLYENRVTAVDSANPNRTVEAILGMHRRNFV